jgi:hypothetical protein
MKDEEKLSMQKKQIQELGLNAIQEYFKIDTSQFDKNFVFQLHQKARLGMTFEKEMNLSKRAIEMNYLRVFKIVAEDKKEYKKLIKKTIPHYLPD